MQDFLNQANQASVYSESGETFGTQRDTSPDQKEQFMPSNALSPNLQMRKSNGRLGWRDLGAKTIIAILLQIAFSSLSLSAQSPQSSSSPGAAQITFSESVVGFPSGSNRKAAALVRSELTQAESEATIEFSVALKMRDFAALKERIANHEIISPEEMAAKYLPSESDYTKIVAWLTKQGISVKPAGQYRLSIFASGTVAQIESIFGTKFGRVNVAGFEYTSALTAPSLPGEIGASVLGINGLQPHLHPRHHFMVAPTLQPQKLVNNNPPYTVPEIAKAYHADGLPTNGSGQKIGIVIDTFPIDSDLTTFWANNGVPQTLGNIEKVQVVGGALPSPSGEETLDTEWSSSLASGAKVRIYATTDLSFVHLDQAYQFIINELPSQPALRQVSMSFGLGELYEAPAQLRIDSQYFAALAAQGVTVFVSTGDGGSTPGPNGFEDNSGPLQVESPACDPSVTAVGGTSLYLNTSTGGVASESAWFYGGGGQSQIFGRPSWQTGAGMPTGSGRLVPDVALVADLNTGGYLILDGQLRIVGGTSWGAPSWAGFCAEINQARAARGLAPLGLLGSRIYALNPQSGKADFSDIVTGSNGTNGFYNAGPGFDLCTGLGVPNVFNLFQTLTKRVAKDFNGDGQADLVWEETVTGQRGIWILNDGLYSYSYSLPSVPTQWHIAGAADFLGNGQTDLAWENLATGECGIWILNNGVYSYSIMLPSVSTQWKMVGAADFLGNGKAGLVWENTATGERAIWVLNSGAYSYSLMLPTVPTQWHIAGAADFLDTGQAGLVWENTVTGERAIWVLKNGVYSYSITLPSEPTQWHIAGAADFLGTGQAGLVWENTATGVRGIWILNNGAYAYTIYLPTVSTDWKIVDH
jgi:kumamolisin